MDRMEEYKALLDELEETPPALEYTVRRAQARKRRGRWGRRLGIPAGSVAAAFAAFVLLVNLSAPFAMACSNVPFLKDLAAAVAFSPSLKAAVEHDYVQRIDQTQTQNGVTLTLNYLIPDQGQLIFFVTAAGPEGMDSFMVHPDFQTVDGAELEGLGSTSHSFQAGELSSAFAMLAPDDGFVFPDVLRVVCEVEGRFSRTSEAPAQAGDLEEEADIWRPNAVFTFDVPLNTALLNRSQRIEVGKWLELDGNRIRVDSLEIYPTHARLTLEEDPANTETLSHVEFYLEDETGARYEKGSSTGISALGSSYWCESPFFSQAESLTLHITEAHWLEKGREYLTIDLEAGAALDPLPEGVSVYARRTSDRVAEVVFLAPSPPESDETHMHFYQIAYLNYRTPEGEERDTGGVSSHIASKLWPNTPDEVAIPEGFFCEEYLLTDYPWDTVEWKLAFTRRAVFETPVALPLS